MLLTQKLLAYLNRVFDKDPAQFLALRLSYDGLMSWSVENAVLRTVVVGGSGQALEVDLADYTISGLASHLADMPGYTVLYVDGSDLAQLSSRVLLDAGNDIAGSNGDHLYGYTNVLWAFLESAANELTRAKAQIVQMLRQMSTRTAGDIWLDELGGYYSVPRLTGELDDSYGQRIVAEVLRPRENNVAMEAAIKVFTGQNTKVTDVSEFRTVLLTHDGSFNHDGSQVYNSTSVESFNLFDVDYGYDLEKGGSFADFHQVVLDLIERLRAAGTHLRALSLTGSQLSDAFQFAPTDNAGLLLQVGADLEDAADAPAEAVSMAVRQIAMTDALDGPGDGLDIAIGYSTTYSGLRRHDGSIAHLSGEVLAQSL